MDYKEKFISLINDKTLPIEQRKKLEEIYNSCVDSENERTRKDIINFVKSRIAGFPECERFVAWLEKQAPQEQDGFEAELNALLKKYEHLPKHELADSLEFYLGIVNKSEAKMVDANEPNSKHQDIMKMLQSIYEVLVSINNKYPVQIIPHEPPHDLRPYCEVENMDCKTTNKLGNE